MLPIWNVCRLLIINPHWFSAYGVVDSVATFVAQRIIRSFVTPKLFKFRKLSVTQAMVMYGRGSFKRLAYNNK